MTILYYINRASVECAEICKLRKITENMFQFGGSEFQEDEIQENVYMQPQIGGFGNFPMNNPPFGGPEFQVEQIQENVMQPQFGGFGNVPMNNPQNAFFNNQNLAFQENNELAMLEQQQLLQQQEQFQLQENWDLMKERRKLKKEKKELEKAEYEREIFFSDQGQPVYAREKFGYSGDMQKPKANDNFVEREFEKVFGESNKQKNHEQSNRAIENVYNQQTIQDKGGVQIVEVNDGNNQEFF